MKHCFIDVETTGLIPSKHSIIQIGIIIGDKEHSFCMQPFDGAQIEEQALIVNGITMETLKDWPTYENARRRFMSILDANVDKFDKYDKMFFTAYNAPFDEGFVRKLVGTYFGSYFWWPAIDVAVLAAMHLKKQRRTMRDFKLTTVYEKIVEKPLEHAHDALADIRATKEIFDICTGGKDA
jgi:DNA polymerase-3 subunit epsilon